MSFTVELWSVCDVGMPVVFIISTTLTFCHCHPYTSFCNFCNCFFILVTVIFFGDFQILGSVFHDSSTLYLLPRLFLVIFESCMGSVFHDSPTSHLQANNRCNDMHNSSIRIANLANDVNRSMRSKMKF